jgi:hypothetical protein
MKKLFQNITIIALVVVTILGLSENVQALGNTQSIAANVTKPVRQVVVYASQSIAYDNFNSAIFAQGQLGEVSKLPTGSEVSFYIDTNKINGAAGLQAPGKRCSTTQSGTSYYQNTITMDKRFCSDFNDAILDGRAVYGMVPTESVFIHKPNGERCYISGNGGGIYMINPASEFYRNYLVKRSAEKMQSYNLNTLFLDDVQPGQNTLNCDGASKEYPNYADYSTQMVELSRYVKNSMPNYKIEANLANANAEWDKFTFLDGAMCENCFTNWGGAWPSASRMIYDLNVMDKWIKGGHKVYVVIQPPDTSAASNRFTFAATLLAANGDNVFFHFGGDYRQFYSLPEYQYALGAPAAERVCNGNICTRQFQYGTVTVDFGKLTGTILLQGANTPQATFTATLPLPTATKSTPTSTLVSPTATVLVPSSPTPTPVWPTPTATRVSSTQIPFTPTASVVPVSPTATNTAMPTVVPPTNSVPTNTVVPIPGTNSVDVRVSAGIDDVEEVYSGGMNNISNDLELVYDKSGQVVGMRFNGVKIPQGAVITNAYVQFRADEASNRTVNLTINGEASANASMFTTAPRNLSRRPRTSNSVAWAPPAWSRRGDMGAAQQTPNLKSVVQEIVNQPSWVSGNSLVIIITGKSNKRVAKSFEGDPSSAPLLHVEYSMPAQPTLMILPTTGITATATATLLPTLESPTLIPPTFTPVPTEILPSPTIEPTATEVIVITDTPIPTLVPPIEVVIPTDTPISAAP